MKPEGKERLLKLVKAWNTMVDHLTERNQRSRLRSKNTRKILILLVAAAGLEPATYGL